MILQEYFLHFLIFMLGASFASFISVFVERGDDDKFFNLRNNKRSRSICTNCLRKLNFFELIPIFSFIFLRGKCKVCKTKIPTKLFFGEIILGIWFLASFLFIPNFLEIILSWFFGVIFFILALEDFESMEVSPKYIYLLLVIGIINTIFRFFYIQNIYELFVPILIISPFWLIYLINKKYIGEADPFVYTALALFFGIQFTFSLFLYSVWFGAAYGLFYLYFINKKFERNIRIPFLPIILFSTLFILVTSYHIIKISDILLINEFFL